MGLPPLSDAILVDHSDAIRLFAPPVNPRESICHAHKLARDNQDETGATIRMRLGRG